MASQPATIEPRFFIQAGTPPSLSRPPLSESSRTAAAASALPPPPPAPSSSSSSSICCIRIIFMRALVPCVVRMTFSAASGSPSHTGDCFGDRASIHARN